MADVEVEAGIAELHRWLVEVLGGLDAAGWAAPTRCEGWDVADVVLHLAQTNELAIDSVAARFEPGFHAEVGVDDGAAAAVQEQRGVSTAELLARFVGGADTMRAALAGASPGLRVPWVVGTLSARTLASTRLAETWIHAGDVAEALGREARVPASLSAVARLAWRTLPYAFEQAGRPVPGPVAFRLVGPGGEAWTFEPSEPAATVVSGDGVQLCEIAARRRPPADALGVRATGPDADAVLALVRTYA